MSESTKHYLLTATQVLALIRSNTISVEDYARSLLSRIDDRDSIVKAWEYLGKLHPSQFRVHDGKVD